MWIENFINAYIKQKNSKYLRFEEHVQHPVPCNRKNKSHLLYIHIPFCEELCPFCSFHRFVWDRKKVKTYFKSVKEEILLYTRYGYTFSSVYIGGGTPTIDLDELKSLVSFLRKLNTIEELSVETNPHHLTRKNLVQLKNMGINRLSVGVQSFNDSLLKQMKRYEKYGSGREIKDRLLASTSYFDTLNIDMIFNYPGQTESMLEHDLNTIISLKADQVTFYPLMLSRNTLSNLINRPVKHNLKRERKFYYKILKTLSGEYSPSSVWCFSKNRDSHLIDEYIINHDEYVGVGSGAFGYLDGTILANTFSLEEYNNLVRLKVFPLGAHRKFSKKEQVEYDFVMALFGGSLDIKKLIKKYSSHFYRSGWQALFALKVLGALRIKGSRVMLTKKGMYYWLILMREFFTGVNNFREHCRKKVHVYSQASEIRVNPH